ncbi:protein-serine/threonine phosphatase PrpC [soil metagenome]
MNSRADLHLHCAALSDAGRVRPHNEDSVAVATELGLAVLADGMGGYNAGEVASGLATRLLIAELESDLGRIEAMPPTESFPLRQMLQARINQVNLAIYEAAQTEEGCEGMGTTLVLALFFRGRLTVAHVGDSRAYRLRNGALEQLTRDHSLLQEQIEAGLLTPTQARYSMNRNLVTRAVGVDPTVVAEIHEHDVRTGDIVLMCSDGLNDMIADEVIATILVEADGDTEIAAGRLIEAAKENGGRDNVSVILIRVDGGADLKPGPEAAGIISRVRHWLG